LLIESPNIPAGKAQKPANLQQIRNHVTFSMYADRGFLIICAEFSCPASHPAVVRSGLALTGGADPTTNLKNAHNVPTTVIETGRSIVG